MAQGLPRWELPKVEAPERGDAAYDVFASAANAAIANAGTGQTTTVQAIGSAAPAVGVVHSSASRLLLQRFRDVGAELVQSGAEWVGLFGSRSNWMTRLTAAAVSLVLVSGLSLLLATTDGPSPLDELSPDELQLSESASLAPQTLYRDRSVQPAGASEEAGQVQSADYQASAAPRPRGAWLEGRIELE